MMSLTMHNSTSKKLLGTYFINENLKQELLLTRQKIMLSNIAN